MARYGKRIEARTEEPQVGEVYRKLEPHVGFMVLIRVGDFYCYYITIDESGQVVGTGHATRYDFRRRDVAGYVTDTRWSTSNNQLEIEWREK